MIARKWKSLSIPNSQKGIAGMFFDCLLRLPLWLLRDSRQSNYLAISRLRTGRLCMKCC